MLAHHQFLTIHFEVCSSRKQEKSGFEKRLWDRPLPGPCRYYSSKLGSIASLLSAPCWRIISVSKQVTLRVAGAESKRRVVLITGCGIDSSPVRVAITLPGLVPLLPYSQLHVGASSVSQNSTFWGLQQQKTRKEWFWETVVRSIPPRAVSLLLFPRLGARQMDWKNRKTKWYEAVSSALNFPFLKDVSQNCFVFGVVNFKKISFGGIPNSRNVLFLQIFLKRAAKQSARKPGFRELIGRTSCWTWPGSAPKPPRPSPEPSPEPSAPRWRHQFVPGSVSLSLFPAWFKLLALKVLRPYFLSPCRKWHKKGSSPRNHSNVEVLRPRVYSNVVGFHGRGLIAMSWVLRPRVLAIFTRDSLTILEPLYVPFRSFMYLLGPYGRIFWGPTHENSRKLTISHD